MAKADHRSIGPGTMAGARSAAPDKRLLMMSRGNACAALPWPALDWQPECPSPNSQGAATYRAFIPPSALGHFPCSTLHTPYLSWNSTRLAPRLLVEWLRRMHALLRYCPPSGEDGVEGMEEGKRGKPPLRHLLLPCGVGRCRWALLGVAARLGYLQGWERSWRPTPACPRPDYTATQKLPTQEQALLQILWSGLRAAV